MRVADVTDSWRSASLPRPEPRVWAGTFLVFSAGMSRPSLIVLLVLLAVPVRAQDDPRGSVEVEARTVEADPSTEATGHAEVAEEHAEADGVVDISDPALEEDEPEPVSPGENGVTPSLDVIEQAGVGGTVPYGRQNTLEVGGTGSIHYADTGFFGRLSPYAGWFVIDGVELTYANDFTVLVRDDDQILFSLAVTLEASVHIPLIDRLWLAIGCAGGVLYDGNEAGGIVTGRLGIDNLVGRSGMLHVSALATYASSDLAGPTATAEQETHWRVGAEIGYSVLF